MNDRPAKRDRLRASDHDREEVVTLLKAAMDDGRLKMDEYVDRMGKAYEATTYGELALLHDDLPAPGTLPAQRTGVGAVATAGVDSATGMFGSLPTALKVLWTIWFASVAINLMVWVLVGLTGPTMPYPWPLWVAGPSGAALFGVSVGVRSIKKGKPQRPIPPAR